MEAPIQYSLTHAAGSVELVLENGQLTVRTKGVGVIDKLKTITVPISELQYFTVVPTIGIQNMAGRAKDADGNVVKDTSFDSEFIFSYQGEGKIRKKRVFVLRDDSNFQALLKAIQSKRPAASLLHLEPAAAMKQIGVMSARTMVFWIVGLLVGVPVGIALVTLAIQIARGFK